MHIFICTYGRANRQVTWQNLPLSIRNRTRIVVQERDDNEYPGSVLILPAGIQTISDTRRFLCEAYGPKILMLDDDLTFAVRRIEDPTKFAPADPINIEDSFQEIEYLLDHYPAVGMSGREGANRNPAIHRYCTRMMRVLGFDTSALRDLNVKFGRVQVMEDFDIILQVLRAGRKNCVLNWIVQDQGSSNAPGGCSTFRTPELQKQSAEMLAELHPGFVKVVENTTKTGWYGGGTRYDVRIQWLKAYESAGDARVLDTGT